jgi:hypothetical protein
MQEKIKIERDDSEAAYYKVFEILENIKKPTNLEGIIGQPPQKIIQKYLQTLEEVPEEVIASTYLFGNSEAVNSPVESIVDIMTLKRLLIYLFESNKSNFTSKVETTQKEVDIFESKSNAGQVRFEDICNKLLTSILSLENIMLSSLNENINIQENALIRANMAFSYEDFNQIITLVDEKLKFTEDEDSKENNQQSDFKNFNKIIYNFLINSLNFHLLSQTNEGSLNGDVFVDCISDNHTIQKNLPDLNKKNMQYLVDSISDINLDFCLFLKFIHSETRAREFIPTQTNPKKIRQEITNARIAEQAKWVDALSTDRNLDETRYETYMGLQNTDQDADNILYNQALKYFLQTYNNSDFEFIFDENLETISNEIEIINNYNNFESYRNICVILNIPYKKDMIEPKVLEILKLYNKKSILNQGISDKTGEVIESNEKKPQFTLNNLPEFILIDKKSLEDFQKNELFQDSHREYIQKIIEILINTKVEDKDDILYKYLYLKKCINNPAQNGLTKKKEKILNEAKEVFGIGTIPDKHFRIRVNKRGRMIVGLDEVQNKIVLMITDGHDLLK